MTAINFDCEAIGKALDAPTACYRTANRESLIGAEITDLGGRLAQPHVAVFITCDQDGRKVFLTASQAHEIAAILTAFAARLEAGARSAETS